MAASKGVSLDEHISDQIADLDEALVRIDEVFGNLNTVDYHDVTKNMTSLDKAKYDLTNMYAINSLFWMYLRSFGDDPKNTQVKEELDRIKQQMLRLSQIANKAKMPRVDKDAAGRFVRHSLPKPGANGKGGSKLKQVAEPADDENWDEEAMETDANANPKSASINSTMVTTSRKREREEDDEEGLASSSDDEVVAVSDDSSSSASDGALF